MNEAAISVNVNQLIVNIIELLVIPIMGVLAGKLVKLIDAKVNHISDTNLKEFLHSSLNEVNVAVNTAVNKVAQTYVNDLKKAGKFTVEDHKKAFEDAYRVTMEILSEDTIEFLNMQLTSEGFKSLISAKIEEVVGDSKIPALPFHIEEAEAVSVDDKNESEEFDNSNDVTRPMTEAFGNLGKAILRGKVDNDNK